MIEKRLGKIISAEFGVYGDGPWLVGLQLGFSTPGLLLDDGGSYVINISPACRFSEEERREAITLMVDSVHKVLTDANVSYISELIGKPVEITIDDLEFTDFRILTEVL